MLGCKVITDMQLLVTGANGFVGHSLCVEAVARGFSVRAVSRTEFEMPVKVEHIIVANIDGGTVWHDSLTECDAVIHLAARVHMLEETSQDSLAEFRRINVEGTLNLARQAAAAGVRRFVFVSSIGVNGSETFLRPFSAQDTAAPHSNYAMSKYEAELGLQVIVADSCMDLVILRPPLVYGPNAPGNFGSLMRWLRRGLPLPLGTIRNKRSLVALDNLVDLIMTCLTHPAAADQTFLVSDGEDVSTAELLRRMGRAMGRPARLIPVPASWLKLAAALVGKQDVAQRLCGSLQVDIEKTRRLLGWSPPLTLDQGLKKAAEGIRV